MNILIATAVFYPEPIVMSTITEDLATELAKHHNVLVLTSKPCRPYGYKLPEEIVKQDWKFKRTIINSYIHPKSDFIGRLRENISFGKTVAKYIELHNKDIDVVYMNAFPLFAQKRIVKQAKKYGIATVNHIEDIYPEPFRQKIPIFGDFVYKLLLPIDKWLIRNSTYSVVIGVKIKEYYVATRKINSAKIKVVYNWQDESRFQRPILSDTTSNPFTFMYVGSISHAADLHNVLTAFALADVPNTKLVLAGSGTEKEMLINETRNYPNSDIEFVEAPFERVAEIQAKSDVLILPLLKGVSLRAVPSKLPAYLFSKKPIIACVDAESDVADIITTAQCGKIVPTQNPDALSEAIKTMAHLPNNELIAMGQSGYAFSQKYLTREVNLHKLTRTIVDAGADKR